MGRVPKGQPTQISFGHGSTINVVMRRWTQTRASSRYAQRVIGPPSLPRGPLSTRRTEANSADPL